MLDHISDLARYAAREIRARRNLRDLLEKEDRLLQDIGLTRTDVESALMRRFGEAAGVVDDLDEVRRASR